MKHDGCRHADELNVCQICANCSESDHPWYYCECDDEDFGNYHYPNECEDFEHLDDDEDDDWDEDDDQIEESIECPQCGGDAYWEGGYYACEECGWCSN